jgi:hypothetical protein
MQSVTPIPTHRQIPPTMLAAMDELTAEDDLFEHQGKLYYRHESGIIFAADIYAMANSPGVDTTTVACIPAGAVPYELLPGTMREQRTDAWTNGCDAAIRKTALT